MKWINDFAGLLCPRLCVCCGHHLWPSESVICHHCSFHLPKTWYHLEKDNPVSRIFWGRIRVEQAASFLLFNKGNRVQTLMHHLKYKGQKEIGIFLGKQYGSMLNGSQWFKGIDLILPVPLHPKKQLQRGYNQSEQFALGLSESMRIPLESNVLFRTTHTGTQTRKSRFQRWENVNRLFQVTRPAILEGKHLLLVDDVITTGATMEACGETLLSIPGTRISLASIAVTSC